MIEQAHPAWPLRHARINVLASISAAGGSAYWLYQNSNVELTKITQPDTSQPIVAEDQATDGVTYDGSVEITSTEQLQEYRNDTSQPLYLRNYLSMPSLGINLQIYEGTSNRVLTYGAGAIKPGQIVDSFTNYAVAAHNFSDAQWGHGFSMLQTYPDVYGRQAYISDGDYVYTYTMVSYDNVYRDDSMKYTEDDWRQQFLQEQIKTIAPKEYTQGGHTGAFLQRRRVLRGQHRGQDAPTVAPDALHLLPGGLLPRPVMEPDHRDRRHDQETEAQRGATRCPSTLHRPSGQPDCNQFRGGAGRGSSSRGRGSANP